MKQSALLRWIEAAEARSVCLIAEEDPVWESKSGTHDSGVASKVVGGVFCTITDRGGSFAFPSEAKPQLDEPAVTPYPAPRLSGEPSQAERRATAALSYRRNRLGLAFNTSASASYSCANLK